MAEFDWNRYRELLADAAPVVIDSEENYDRLIDRAQHLMERGRENLSPEESKLLELLVFLIEAAHRDEVADEDEDEDQTEGEIPAPHETLRRLLESRGLELSDVQHIFGNPHAAREFIEGRRAATRGQAKQLGKFFGVPNNLFIA
jgi:HTH-type transcriptional regulator/antitoxin HigA